MIRKILQTFGMTRSVSDTESGGVTLLPLPLSVLVVDDEASIREMLSDVLSHAGCTVVVAADGNEALRLCDRRTNRFDLVMLDVIMPRMTGRETLECIHDIDPDQRVLLMSGYVGDIGEESLDDLGAAGFLRKPFRQKELFDAIRKAVRKRAAAS